MSIAPMHSHPRRAQTEKFRQIICQVDTGVERRRAYENSSGIYRLKEKNEKGND